MTNPHDDWELLSCIILGGFTSPGACTLSGHKRVENLDVVEAKAQSGATTVRQGEKVGTFTATFYLIVDPSTGIDEFAEWEEFQKLIDATTSGKEPVAVDIYHPDLARNRFKSVIKQEMGEIKYDEVGGGTVSVIFSEYYPKKATPSKGSTGSKSGGAKDEYDKKIDEVLNELMGNGKKAP